MSKSVVIKLGSGNLYQGFSRVTVQLWTAGSSLPEQFIGTLPAAPALVELHRNWQLVYRGLCDRTAVKQLAHPRSEPEHPFSDALEEVDPLEISEAGITNVSQVDFDELCQQIRININSWLKSAGFLPIEYQLRSRLNLSDPVRVIVETNDLGVRQLPWHAWTFLEDYPKAEIALSQPEYQYYSTFQPVKTRRNVKILAVLGNSYGLDLDLETRLLQRLQDAEVTFLVNPSRQELNTQLWQPEGWDILFFAGHSQTEKQTGRIYINEGKDKEGRQIPNSLTISQLGEALKASIEKGLKLAIFNSCDGLGLAQELEKLHIPIVIVTREPIPNRIAQEFFQQFLSGFAIDQLPLYLAVQQARRKLQGWEDDFPAASWLPVICQNLAVEPPTWLQLGGIPPCPYRGLFAFQEEDASLFFGREKFTEDLLMAVKRTPLVAVVGCSGSGKSSVVFAGLVPRLRQDANWQYQIISFRPGANPLEALAAAISSLDSGVAAKDLAIALRQDDQSLSNIIKSLVSSPDSRFVLIVDQCEELYSLCSEEDRKPLLDNLLNAVKSASAFSLVLTLRADFYGYALSYRPLSDALQGAVYNLGPMSQAELKSAIEQPAIRNGVALEAGLSNQLIKEVGGQPGSLPLLEFALTQLWSKQREGILTHAAYAEIGGMEVALANHAEAVYARLNDVDRQRAQQIFMQLVQLGEETEPTRRLANRDDIKEENWDLVANLASSRLVVTNYNDATAEETVEIVHETLIRSWGRLEQWMQTDGDFRRWQQQLRAARQQWETHHDDGLLLRGKPLTDAEYWYLHRCQELSSSDIHFVQQSLNARNSEIRKQRRRRHLTIYGLAGGLMVALMLTGAAFYQWRQSRIREVEALSRSSEALFATNKKLEALIESIRAKRILQKIGRTDISTQTLVDLSLEQAVYGLVEHNRLAAHVDGVRGVAFSPDGQIIASVPEDNIIKLWNADGTLRTTLEGHKFSIIAVAFSPDGKTIASASADQTIKLWNIDGTLLRTIEGHNAEVTGVAFSPDGKTIASSSNDKTIKLWNTSGALLKTIEGHSDGVTDIAFSPDGKTIASSSNDKTIKLWNIDGTLLRTIAGHSAEVTGIAFSPDGKTIASSSNDKTIKLWNINGTLQTTLSGHSAEVTDVAFSPDGQTIASASADKTIKLWKDNGTLVATLEGHGDIVWGIDFSPDGKTLASASWDSTVRLWTYKNPLLTILVGHQAGITGVAFSPNGQTVASASDDRTIKLWSIDGRLLKTLQGHSGRVYGVTFSPDGQTLASASDDRTVKLWSIDGRLLKTFQGHTALVWDVAFSPDGQTLASASDDKTVRLWNLDGTLRTTLRHQGTVLRVVFSPDGQTIASFSNDTTVKLWKLDGTLLRTMAGHNEMISGGDISPDGQTIASASADNTIKLWSFDGNLLRTIEGHGDQVQSVKFSPDGQTLASVSDDETVKLWSLDGTLLKTLKRHSAPVWGVDYSPDVQTVASSSADGTVILWHLPQLLDLDELGYACNQIRDYLKHGADVEEHDRTLCDQ